MELRTITFFFEVSVSVETDKDITDLSDILALCPELECTNANEVGDVTYIAVHDKEGELIEEWSL